MQDAILPPSACASRDDYRAQFPSCESSAPNPWRGVLTPEQREQAEAAIRKMLQKPF